MKGRSYFKTLLALVVAFTLFIGVMSASAKCWKFGVMSDTQWTLASDPAGQNHNGVAGSIINQLNTQFINHGVKFVIQVGDLTENGNNADIDVRAAAVLPLINKSIGFFPIRGNHETYANPASGYGISEFQWDFPQTQGFSDTFGATNFKSPILAGAYPDGSSDPNFPIGVTPEFNFVKKETWCYSLNGHEFLGIPGPNIYERC